MDTLACKRSRQILWFTYYSFSKQHLWIRQLLKGKDKSQRCITSRIINSRDKVISLHTRVCDYDARQSHSSYLVNPHSSSDPFPKMKSWSGLGTWDLSWSAHKTLVETPLTSRSPGEYMSRTLDTQRHNMMQHHDDHLIREIWNHRDAGFTLFND